MSSFSAPPALRIRQADVSNALGAIFGFAILKTVSVTFPPWLGGGYFGEKENVTVQTAATGELFFDNFVPFLL